MNANFWGKMADEYLKDNPEPPPLTEEVLTKFEQRIGLKLPQTLTDLLQVKNGGLIQNTDFRFSGKDYQVTYVKAVTFEDSYHSIRTYSSILSDPEAEEARLSLQQKAGDLSKLLLVAESLDGPDAFALNYDDLNTAGEPTAWVVALTYGYGEEAKAKRIADSFAEFLDGQYSGDEAPIVDLKEAAKYRLIAEGGYDGRYTGDLEPGSHTLSGLPIRVRWKICSHRMRLIVFQDINWGGQLKITREVIHKSALTFDFPSLESYDVELEPELAEMIRPAIEINVLSKYEAPIIPDCYELLLHIQHGRKRWVSIDSSSPYNGRWKNSNSEVLYSSLKSASKSQLARVLKAVADSCSGLRRCFG